MLLEEATNRNVLLQSGIAASDPVITQLANEGGRTMELPFWDDLDTSNDLETGTDTDDEVTAYGITSNKDVAVKMFFNYAWNAAPLIKYANTGKADPAKFIVERVANWWNTKYQQLMLSILTGVFSDSTIASNLSNDISTEDGDNATSDNLVSLDSIDDTRFLLGDRYGNFTAIAIHSTVFQRLRRLNLIDMVPQSDQKLDISMYNGLAVLVDDNMTTEDGSTSGTKYISYLFGRGAFATADIALAEPNLEWYREPTKGTGSGSDTFITRRGMVLHPRGIAWAGSITSGNGGPTIAQLEADNWTQAYQTKNIKIARMITNG
jgi:hypothetical protein